MSAKPWLALDRGTSLRAHAREMRLAWECFVAEHDDTGARVPIAESWRRSQQANIDPARSGSAPCAADAERASEQWAAHPLAAAAALIEQTLADIAAESGHIV